MSKKHARKRELYQTFEQYAEQVSLDQPLLHPDAERELEEADQAYLTGMGGRTVVVGETHRTRKKA